MKQRVQFSLFVFLICVTQTYASAKDYDYDLIVYGATPSGIMAATAAKKEGVSVLIVEPGKYLGGMVAGGLGRTDVAGREFVGGLTKKYFDEVASYTKSEKQTPGRPWDLESHIAEKVFKDWIQKAETDVVFGRRLVRVVKDGNVIRELVFSNGKRYSAKIFIDASYEGDLMALAGVSYTCGRECTDEYNEPAAGVHFNNTVKYTKAEYTEPCICVDGKSNVHYLHNSNLDDVSPFDPDNKICHGIVQSNDVEEGSGDNLTQAYTYRVTATRRADIKVPWTKPEKYQVEKYQLLLKYIQARPGICFSKLVHIGRIPNGKFDINSNGPFSTDYVSGNFAYTEGNNSVREVIRKDHENYVKGFFWFLANDRNVPEKLRNEVRRWGLCKDEYIDNGHWPYQLYVREARRMKGSFVMTQKDITTDINKPDAIAMGSFSADSHPVRRLLTAQNHIREEGHLLLPVKPYQIPFRSIIPLEKECNNLLVPVCLSASHVACCSIRMEPVYMIMGHSAGVAAALAVKSKNHSLFSINYQELREILIAQGQVLYKN